MPLNESSHRQFVHLHNHSHYSLLDGATQIDDMIARAVELKMPALALTDHGVLFGAIELYKSAKKAGIKPIVGCEMYVAKGKRNEKNGYNHLTVLAKNYTGYKNLVKLVSAGPPGRILLQAEDRFRPS